MKKIIVDETKEELNKTVNKTKKEIFKFVNVSVLKN